MAKAIQHRVVSITLELNEDEAQVLRDVLDNIGGLGNSRRGITDEIKQALSNAGIYGSEKDDIDPNHSCIYFTV